MYSKFGQFIDGKWQSSADKATYDVINPATEEIIGKASKASPIDVDKALKSAEKGFEVWKKVKPWERSKIIRKIADEIRKKNEVFAKWMTLETGKTLAEGEAETAAAADARGDGANERAALPIHDAVRGQGGRQDKDGLRSSGARGSEGKVLGLFFQRY